MPQARTRRDRSARHARTMSLFAAAIVLGGGCGKKSTFFAPPVRIEQGGITPSTTTLQTNVSGNGQNAVPFSVSGPNGTTVNGSTASSQTFSLLPPGLWSISVLSSPAGLNCTASPQSQQATAGATAIFNIVCVPLTGTIVVTVTGLAGGAALGVTLTGPGGPLTGQVTSSQSFTAQVGAWSYVGVAPAGFICSPLTQLFTLAAAATQAISVVCSAVPTTGTINVGVSGITGTGASNINVSGPTMTAGTIAGSGVRSFTGLLAGAYTITLTPAAGFSCTVTVIQVVLVAGGTQNAQFVCAVAFIITGTGSHFHFVGFSKVCLLITTSPPQAGASGTARLTRSGGGGVTGSGMHAFVLNGSGQATLQNDISLFGLYSWLVTINALVATIEYTVGSPQGNCT